MFISLRGLVMCLFPFCIQRTVSLDQLHLALGALSLCPFLVLSLLLLVVVRLLLLSMVMVVLTDVLGLAFLLV